MCTRTDVMRNLRGFLKSALVVRECRTRPDSLIGFATALINPRGSTTPAFGFPAPTTAREYATTRYSEVAQKDTNYFADRTHTCRFAENDVMIMHADTNRGIEVLLNPIYNKGTGFSLAEKERLGIRGLTPPRYFTIEQQCEKIWANLTEKGKTGMFRWRSMQALQDRNETLFYRLLVDHIEELAPVIYTPTVGEACLQYSRLFRRPRGMYFSADDVGHFNAMMYNWKNDVSVIVVTDGSRVLGLGDLGAHGMGISVGKLDLYVAGAGIEPSSVLPCVLDVGTDNEELLTDPYYFGLPQKRINGDAFMNIVD